ncbi:MAG: glycosyltransferase [Syntrophorhabdaceae bacterium]|nr:glycosyltransferase [Syntrophorhabdaceae bacterium]MDD4196764.1 glycosyltransferase [Syntrophorhabdaceae bacterium]
MIERYSGISPKGDLILLRKLADRLADKTFLHINSTREGGGVAEILQRMIPIMSSLGIKARWDVITGDDRFFDMTKKVHNALQGYPETIDEDMWDHHRAVNETNATLLDLEADATIIHDPQPLPLINFRKNGVWIWRCHIDVSNPQKDVFGEIGKYVSKFDAALYSVSRFAGGMSRNEFIVSPSIDPLAEKNRELGRNEIEETARRLDIPLDRPVVLQVSRFDRFKDPTGVIMAYRKVKKYNDCVLVLAGSPATDDPEGAAVLNEVRQFASNDPDVRILLLPPFSDKDINALQRIAAVILQKSLKEGFGLTVTEGMWKGKPVIGGAAGGIPLQITHGVTGFLVHSIEGTAFRIRQLLNNSDMAGRMGQQAREYVRRHFLITRQVRDYLAVWYALSEGMKSLIEL